MHSHSEQSPFEQKVRIMAAGFGGFPTTTTEVVLRGEKLMPAMVVARFRKMIERFEAVREHAAKHTEAVESCARELDSDRAFYADAITVVRSHFGSDEAKLATFGLASAKKMGRSRGTGRRGAREVVTTTVVEEIPERGRPSVEVVEVTETIEPASSRRAHRRTATSKPSVVQTVPSTGGLPPPVTPTSPSSTKKKGKGK
jgi:hypothetical protein